MSLEIVPNRLGLWCHPQWSAGMPGVYALIAGVSAYPHLGGGTAPAPDVHGLEQLVSSANTAASLFKWLGQSFKHRDLPVVWCYLLLSPTPAERAAFSADGLLHYTEPTYLNLQQAIQLWTGNVPQSAPAARASRTLFFFSGHGVQSNWNALLLPSDYLDPTLGQTPHYENCISTADLRKWMEENPIGEHLALIDACCNEFPPLATKGATAHSVFPTNPPGGAAPRTAATLAAASPNTIAYQLQNEPLTFFGEAVLEAVEGVGDPTRSELPFRELVDYVKPRVNVLLKEAARTTLEQTVRPHIDGDDHLIVTEIDRGATPAAITLRSIAVRSPVPRGPGTKAATLAIAERAEATLIVNKDPIPLAALRASSGEAQRRFGHEYASDVWSTGGVAMHSLVDGTRLADGATVIQVSRDEPSSIVHVDLALEARLGGVLLVFEGANYVQRERLAVALPTDEYERVPVRLTIGIASTEPGRPFKIQSLSARLGPGPWNEHYAYLWDLTRQARLSSLIQAAGRADPVRLQRAVEDKVQSQTAAVAGMLLLSRAGQIGKVKDWPRNLMQWFPKVPDGAVLWADALSDGRARGAPPSQDVADPAKEIAASLAALIERGVPFFADSLDIADRLVRQSLRGDLEPERRRQLEQVAHAMNRIFEIAMPAGDFVVLYGLPRPPWLDTSRGAITVREILRALRGPRF